MPAWPSRSHRPRPTPSGDYYAPAPGRSTTVAGRDPPRRAPSRAGERLGGGAGAPGGAAVPPGDGSLGGRAPSPRRCGEARLAFVGPRPETLALLGDKAAARALAERCRVPVPRGTRAAVSLD